MIVECYTEDVYCDCADHQYNESGSMGEPAVFTGRNHRETDHARVRAGWKKICGKDVCPVCQKRRPIRMKEE